MRAWPHGRGPVVPQNLGVRELVVGCSLVLSLQLNVPADSLHLTCCVPRPEKVICDQWSAANRRSGVRRLQHSIAWTQYLVHIRALTFNLHVVPEGESGLRHQPTCHCDPDQLLTSSSQEDSATSSNITSIRIQRDVHTWLLNTHVILLVTFKQA